jgi:hypothetical protein
MGLFSPPRPFICNRRFPAFATKLIAITPIKTRD